MKIGTALLGCGLTLLMAACDTMAVRELEATTAQGGTTFTRALTNEYRKRAAAEPEDEMDHVGIFARKGLAAARGELVLPEELTAWKVPVSRVSELTDARARLMLYFERGARERNPAVAAAAQARFDCWIEEESEGEANSGCRVEFLKAELVLIGKPGEKKP
ncbi:MAG: hypothetical protein H7840_08425 [Alphaproteobacteria bacterium]